MAKKWYARPVLFVADIDDAVAFYTDQLGFKEAWRFDDPGTGDPLVAQVDRKGCELILSCQEPDKTGSGRMFIALDQDVLDAARAEFEANGIDVEDGWWGYKLMIVADPDGNELYFPHSDAE